MDKSGVSDGHGKNKHKDPRMSEASFPLPDDDDVANLSHIPLDDDGEEGATARHHRDSGLNDLSFSRDSPTGAAAAAAAAVGGLDDDEDEQASTEDGDDDKKTKKRKQRTGPKYRRTRRKVTIDNDKVELTSAHIKDMLKDTSDITMCVRHPADWNEADEMLEEQDPFGFLYNHHHDDDGMSTVAGSTIAGDSTIASQSQQRLLTQDGTVASTVATLAHGALQPEAGSAEDGLLLNYLSWEELLARPGLGDDGQLDPQLLALWGDNLARVSNRPWPYRVRKAGDSSDEEEEEEDVEMARKAGASDEEDDDEDGMQTQEENVKTGSGKKKDKKKDGEDGDDEEDMDNPQPMDDDDGPMMMMDDDDEEEAGVEEKDGDEEAPTIPFDDDEEEEGADGKEKNKFGLGAWGLVKYVL